VSRRQGAEAVPGLWRAFWLRSSGLRALGSGEHPVGDGRRLGRIAERCRGLGIPKDFAPDLSLTWRHRGYGNAVKERREELRRAAKAQIESLEQRAIVEIEKASVEAQTEIALAGLTSQAARRFVAQLPTVESLMPALSYQELSGETDPPIVEQLISPNALRQRRYRERQKALQALQPRVSNASGDGSNASGDGAAHADGAGSAST
jgi:hypothetical protein